MRLSLLDKAGKPISYKDLKVVLDYVSETAQTTQTAGSGSAIATITASEKAIFAKVEGYIKDLPAQDQATFTKYLSAIQENWGDSREKTRAIIDFESFVQTNGSLSQKSKDAFYDALESFLLADSQQKTDVALAVKVIESLVTKGNANYAMISANLKKIATNPTNTTENKKLATEILTAIKDDSTLSSADKETIKSQLLFLINGKTSSTDTSSSSTSSSSNGGFFGFLIGIFKLFGVLLIVFFGLIGALFIYYQAVADKQRYHTFQDYFIDIFINGGIFQRKTSTESVTLSTNAKKDDILSQLIIPEEPVSKENKTAETVVPESSSALGSEPIPDWMKPVDEKYSPFSPTSEGDDKGIVDFEKTTEPAIVPLGSENLGDTEAIPDWLKGIGAAEPTETTTSELPVAEVELPSEEALAPVTEEAPALEVPLDDSTLPDWLSREEKNEVMDEVQDELDIPRKETIPEEAAEEVAVPVAETVAPEASDSFPDWLR